MEQEDTHQSLRALKVGQPLGQARVVVLTGDRAGRKSTVERKLVFGRSRRSGLQLDDPQVSRDHAQIRRDPAGYVLEDLGSRNGTTLNGKRLRTPTPLQFGDRIRIGDSLLLFTHVDPLEDHVVERQKLEAVGRLGTGIAHDFNNLLGAVRASLDFLTGLDDERTLGDQEVQACLDDIRMAAVGASEMTRRLLGFARHTHRQHEMVNLGELGREILLLLRRTIDRSINLQVEVGESLFVCGDRSHLHQLFMNLCINARDAMPDGGELSVRVEPATEEELQRLPYRKSDDYLLVEVRDTGIGMDEETRKRLFEPFFTTKSEEAGAGLGLATVYEVVDAHGGYIDVESSPGQGATFWVYLPREPVDVLNMQSERLRTRPMVAPGGRKELRVLLVDDEDVMRRSAKRLLRQLGHEVLEAADGLAGLEVFREADPRPDVVVLDLNMPRLNGEKTLERLRRLDPRVQVIVVSGYLESGVLKNLERLGAHAILDKPFEVETLRACLATVVPRSSRR